MRLSGAISSLPFFISIYAHRTYIFTKTILDDNIMLRLDIEYLVIGIVFRILLVFLCATLFRIFNNIFTSIARLNADIGVLQT